MTESYLVEITALRIADRNALRITMNAIVNLAAGMGVGNLSVSGTTIKDDVTIVQLDQCFGNTQSSRVNLAELTKVFEIALPEYRTNVRLLNPETDLLPSNQGLPGEIKSPRRAPG